MRANSIDRLPIAIKRELIRRFVKNGFSQYEEIAEDLRARGFSVSRSALHRWAVKYKRIRILQEEAHLTAYMAQLAGLGDPLEQPIPPTVVPRRKAARPPRGR